MDSVSNIYLVAFLLGTLHALEVDHMVAVTTFSGGTGGVAAAAGHGARWGLGHAAIVIVVGGGLVLFQVTLPGSFSAWAELGVGVALVLLGAWAFRRAGKMHLHVPSEHGGHGHLHAHKGPPEHHHRHSNRGVRHHRHVSTLVGAVHGLAGTAPVVALLPVTMMGSPAHAVGYLVCFGAGTVASMTVYSGLAAAAIGGLRSETGIRMVSRGIAVATVALGGWWVLRSWLDIAAWSALPPW